MSAPNADDGESMVVQSTETDGAEKKVENSNVTEEQWNAMKELIETVVSYRDAEYLILTKHAISMLMFSQRLRPISSLSQESQQALSS